MNLCKKTFLLLIVTSIISITPSISYSAGRDGIAKFVGNLFKSGKNAYDNKLTYHDKAAIKKKISEKMEEERKEEEKKE